MRELKRITLRVLRSNCAHCEIKLSTYLALNPDGRIYSKGSARKRYYCLFCKRELFEGVKTKN